MSVLCAREVSADAWPLYRVIDLANVHDRPMINERGQIAYNRYEAVENCDTGNSDGGIWESGVFVAAGGAPNDMRVLGINEHGIVCGEVRNRYPAFYDGVEFVEVNKERGTAWGMNDVGQFFGDYMNGARRFDWLYDHRTRGVIDIEIPGTTRVSIQDLNNQGQVLCFLTISGSSDRPPVVWTKEQTVPVELPGLQAGEIHAHAINDGGDIAGAFYAFSQGNSDPQVFRLVDGQPQVLESPADAVSVVINEIDEEGVLVGYRFLKSGGWRAMMWVGSEMIGLQDRIVANSTWTLESATDFNAAGQIVGTGMRSDDSVGCLRAFLLQPMCNRSDFAAPAGVLDLADLVGFVGAFLAEEAEADIASPIGVFDLADILAFVAAFESGCG